MMLTRKRSLLNGYVGLENTVFASLVDMSIASTLDLHPHMISDGLTNMKFSGVDFSG